MFTWTVQPMMAQQFIMLIRNRIPLKWVGYQFFSDWMASIDKRLITVPIFDQTCNDYNLYLKKQDRWQSKNPYAYDLLRTLYYLCIPPLKSRLQYPYEKDLFRILNSCDLGKLLDRELLVKNINYIPASFLRRLHSFLLYYVNIEDKFSNKLKW